jgi:arsenate reductase
VSAPAGGADGVEVYWLPHCSTCRTVVARLEARGVSIRSFRNLKTEPLSEAEVRALAEQAGGAARLFSRRALQYRQRGLHQQQLAEDDLVRLMAEEYTFITRPVIVSGGRATAGSAGAAIEAESGG